MIYGINFGHEPIPVPIRKRLERKHKTGTLVGVCNEPSEQNAMAITAHNGSRSWDWKTEIIGSKTWFAMFITYKTR